MSRTVVIPPVTLPGGDAGQIDILLTLEDDSGLPIPSGTAANDAIVAGLGWHTIADEAVTITLATQDELAGTTYYRIVYRQGRERWTKRVQVPAGASMTWAEFAALGAPVDAADIWASRLLPSDAAGGQIAVYDADAGAWVAATASGTGDMLAATYDPQGIGADAFDAANLTGLSAVDAASLGSGLATDGYVLTADGAGSAAWEAATGGLAASDIDTLAKINAIVTDATLIDTGDARLSDARTPTAHATSHAIGESDALAPADIGAATSVQGALADSAVQPADLATVATTGAYSDLSGLPTLGTAAAEDVAAFATGAEGDLAATALQPTDIASGTITPKTGDLDLNSLGGGDATTIKSKVVTLDALSDGDILVYRSGSDEWEVETKPASGSNPALNDVSDVTITGPADNEVLAYDSTSGDWINQTPAEAGFATVATTGAYSDLSGTPTLGTAAAQDVDAFATGAEGDLASSALQPGDIDTLAELNAIITDATLIDTTDARLSDARTSAPPDWTTLTTTGTSPSVTLTIPLDGGAYDCQIPAGGIDVLAYTLPANDATDKQYGAYVKITAPASGTETVTIPAAWDNMGPLAAISLTAGDDAIALVLWTDNDNDSAPTIQYAATQKDLQVSAGGIEAPASDGNYYAYKDGAWVPITTKIIDP